MRSTLSGWGGKNTGRVQTVMSSDPRLGQKPGLTPEPGLTPKPRLAQNSALTSQQEAEPISEHVAQNETGLTSGRIVQPGLTLKHRVVSPLTPSSQDEFASDSWLNETPQAAPKAAPSLPPKNDSETTPRVIAPRFSLTGLHKAVSKSMPGPVLPDKGTTGQHAIPPKFSLTGRHTAITKPEMRATGQHKIAPRPTIPGQNDTTTRPGMAVQPGITLKHRAVSPLETTGAHQAISPLTGPQTVVSQLTAPVEVIPDLELTGPQEMILFPEPVVLKPVRPPRPKHNSIIYIVTCAIIAFMVISVSVYTLVGDTLNPGVALIQFPTQFMAPSHGNTNATPIVVQGRGATATAATQNKQTNKKDKNRPTNPTPIPPATTGGGVSPYLFGTNLGLFDTGDQFISSATTRAALQQIHVRMVRMPVRSNLTMATEIQAAQAIKSIGALPLVILRGVRDANYVADDIAVVKAMNQVFGNTPVYYEFGNEDDLGGIGVTQYTNAWNNVIPQVKPLALNGRFVGPVNFQYNEAYLSTFLKTANPRPDLISWHEYTCSYKWTMDRCMAGLDRWNVHIAAAKAAMQNTIGTVLPIMITEWNYAPDQLIQGNGQPFQDGKYNNVPFITSWTTKALQTLANNHVFASMQYSVTNTALPMVDPNGAVTTQGSTFQTLYQQLVGS
jgi:hypothetical protein